jgi:hypothetical protein
MRQVESTETQDLIRYLGGLRSEVAEILVVDGSPAAEFAALHHLLPHGVVHRHVDDDLRTTMGKVGGVLTGVRHAEHDALVIADDDVRYDAEALQRMRALLDVHDLVRPQNYFEPQPWHALWDTARALLNRMSGGDWPGTMGVRRSVLLRTGGYSGDVMFENLELERTVRAVGGTVTVPLDLYVRRRPPSTRQFFAQRIRQAYDELARPLRLTAQLAILPALIAARRSPTVLSAGAMLLLLVTEAGRRRGGGARYFPASAVPFVLPWLLERGVCSWLAVASQLLFGGIPYRGRVVPRAAHSTAALRRQLQPSAA